jgi:peptide/nickel transport system ATP-binding protein
MADGGEPLLKVEGLTKAFAGGRSLLRRVMGDSQRVVYAVTDVSFSIPRGETFALIGESGSGKSTIARCIAGVLPPSSGRVTIMGHDLGAANSGADAMRIRRNLQMVFQDPYASLNPRWRVFDSIAEPLRTHRLAHDPQKWIPVLRKRSCANKRVEPRSDAIGTDKALDGGGQGVRARVAEMLRLVGLSPEDGRKFPHQFSGGQRQRVSIARALSAEPALIIADEPTSALDVSVQAQILNLMRDLQSRLGLTYLFISHNLAVVSNMANVIGVLYLGRLVEIGPPAHLLSRPRHPYTRLLVDAVPDIDAIGRRRPMPKGEMPDPANPPAGCPFHPRCPLAVAHCKTERPALRPLDGVEVACHRAEDMRAAATDGAGVAPSASRLAV